MILFFPLLLFDSFCVIICQTPSKKSPKWVQGVESAAELRGKEWLQGQRGLSWFWGQVPRAAGLCPCQEARSLPTHLESLLFIFCFGFHWHFLSCFETVSNQTGTEEAWVDQLEPSHYCCLSDSGISTSCPILSSDPSSLCLFWHHLFPPWLCL